MYKGNIHAPKHAKLIYENATAPVFSLMEGFRGTSTYASVCSVLVMIFMLTAHLFEVPTVITWK